MATADISADLVDQIPGFPKAPFKVYSGYLKVKGPFNMTSYDELHIHYQLHMSQRSTSDPVATWHQGGPGGSSLYGGYAEMGYFQVSNSGPYVNPYAWNRRAHMLYLESPAGSSDPIGFSTCLKNGKVQSQCNWNDRSQAEAYAHTLEAFYAGFPELKSNDLYLTGESYAGQYIPNIATYLLEHKSQLNIPALKGIMVGNGCWGGDENTVNCNGPNAQQNNVDLFFGKGLVSRKLKDDIYANCGYNGGSKHAIKCDEALGAMDVAVGPHNVYDIYDNCPGAAAWFEHAGKSPRWLRNYLTENMHDAKRVHEELTAMGGGYDWSCGGMTQVRTFFERFEVQQALHLSQPGLSGFGYQSSGPASIVLYPNLARKIRVLIYNGDADSCVPYNGNEEWTTGLAAKGVIVENKSWHPWFAEQGAAVAAGYATTYTVPGAPGNDFSFVTIRLAGHMVPNFQPGNAYAFFDRYLSHKAF